MIEVELPDGTIVEFPDGTSQDVMQNALRKQFGTPEQPAAQTPPSATLSAGPEPTAFQRLIDGAQEIGLLGRGQANQVRRNTRSAGAAARGAVQGATLGFSDEIGAGVDAVNPASANFGDFEQAVTQRRDQLATDQQLNPAASSLGEIAGGVATGSAALGAGLSASRFVGQGARGLRGFAGRAGAAAVDGAVFGGVQAAGTGQNVAAGAALGAVTGGALQGGGEGIAKAVRGISNRTALGKLSPEQRGQQRVVDAVGDEADTVRAELQRLGPNAVLADALTSGPRQLRRAANLNPDAQGIALERLGARQSGQNERLGNDLREVAGLGPSQTPRDLRAALQDRSRGRINQAFDQAEAAGESLDLSGLNDVLQAEPAQAALTTAQSRANTQAALDGGTPNNFRVADELRKRLGELSQPANRAERSTFDNVQAGQLRDRVANFIDQSSVGPNASLGRALSRRTKQRQDAVTAGQDLARNQGNQNFNAVDQLDPRFNSNAQKGFVSELTDRIGQQRNTAGVNERLSTPAGQRAVQRLFNPSQQQDINNSFARERAFSNTLNGARGNSTTAQQASDIGGASLLETGADVAGNVATGGLSGAVRAVAGATARRVAGRSEREISPFIAEFLTRGQIPQSVIRRPTPEQLQQRQQIIDLLARGGVAAVSAQ